MRLLILSMLSLIFFCGSAQEESKTIPSKIESIRLFYDGAQVNRSAVFQAEAGTSRYLIKGLSAYIHTGSIQAKCNHGSIEGIEYRFNYLDATKNTEEIRLLLEKRDDINRQIQVQANLLDVFLKEEELILKNQVIGGEQNGLKITELIAAADFFRLRLTELKSKRFDISQKIKTLQKEQSAFDAQIAQIQAKTESVTGEIILTLDTKNATQVELDLRYFTSNASWKPSYDVKMNDLTQGLQLVRKADVSQNTGEKWERVTLELSTGNPTFNNTKPQLYPWYLGSQPPYNPRPSANTGSGAGTMAVLTGHVNDASTGESIPFATVILESDGKQIGGTTTDWDGNYTIKPVAFGRYTVKVSFIGYENAYLQNLIINTQGVFTQNFRLNASSVNLDAVVVTEYKAPLIRKDKVAAPAPQMASRKAEEAKYVEGIQVQDLSGIGSELKKIDQSAVVYKLEELQTLPSTGRNHTLTIEVKSMAALYEYVCIPKLDPTAYLIARITSWEDYQLVSGEMNLYFEGTYLGKSMLNVNTTSDTLSLSLGRDPNVIVERKKVKDKSSIQLFGNNRKIERNWEISIRNNKRSAIQLVIEDQYPLSNNGDIRVELTESGNAKVDETKGMLSWKIRLEPAEKKTLNFSYQIKAPVGVSLYIE